MSLFSELRRRNVFRVAVAYSVVAWLVAQIAELARFVALVEQARLVPFWDEIGWPPQCSRDGEKITCD